MYLFSHSIHFFTKENQFLDSFQDKNKSLFSNKKKQGITLPKIKIYQQKIDRQRTVLGTHLNINYFLQFVMIAEGHNEDLDYEEDVAKLKRVWEEIKEPTKKAPKQSLAKTQSNTHSKINQEQKPKPAKQKKTKVIVSQPYLKETTKNPKAVPATVIEVVTQPKTQKSDHLFNDKNIVAAEHLFLTNPQRQVLCDVQSLRRELDNRDYELSMLRVTNSHNEDKIRRLQAQIQQKDKLIDSLKSKQRQLTSNLASLNSKEFNFNYGKVQYQNYRQDSRRLLKMLKSTSEYNKFAEFALDDEGVRFLGNVNKNVKTKLDAPSDRNHFHFCTCNKEFIPEAGLWVPQKVYDYGKEFIKDREGNLSQSQLQLLLYELNKLWRERQKRILNHLNANKAHELDKYKRKLRDIQKGKTMKSKQSERDGQ